VAWGGVLAQLILAVPILLMVVVLNDTDFGYLNPVIVILGYLNLIIALINLTPSEPFDGAVAWRIFALMRAERTSRRAIDRARKKWGRK
jgi:Zn-dependent protease